MNRWTCLCGLVFFVAISGCKDPDWETDDDSSSADDDAADDDTTPAVDNDGDGYTVDDDCDDEDPDIHPGAEEICDGIDNDCDGSPGADEVDADGDGFMGCEGDCDDDDPEIHPDAQEMCNGGIDDDCDGMIDGEDDEIADNDGDGVDSCWDCDDTDPNNFPDNTEICDEQDNDCDGDVDCADADVADADGDGSCVCDDCDDADGANYPGNLEACDGQDNDCDGDVDGLDADVPDTDLDGVNDCDDCDPADESNFPGNDEVCDGQDNDCDGDVDEPDAVDAPTWYEDADGDGYGNAAVTVVSCDQPSGYVANPTDCDDGDATVNPGAAEICNHVDDDCNGWVDDGLPTTDWYQDADGDGYGDAGGIPITDCMAVPGYVADSSDCDDSNPSVNPDADEYCDGIDNDCDGTVDEADALDASTWYQDADADGYGNAAVTLVQCDQPSGYVADATDCDDTNGAINPGEAEICNHIDDNCDGVADEGLATTDYYPDIDGDGFGDANAAPVADCMPISGYVTDATDCDDADAAIYPGASEYCDGVDNDCDGTIDEPDAVDAATWYADADGDGYGDPNSTTTACTQPSGYVADYTDCDDSEAPIYPGATETCNSADDDCNGLIDDNAVDGDWYATDADGDGFGDPGSLAWGCSGIDNEWDCDDTDPTEPVVTDAVNGSLGGAGTLADPLQTVQDAIDVATICVVAFAGTYAESIDFDGKDITVSGVEGAATTIIDASSVGGPVATFENGETSAAVLTGFTLTGGDGAMQQSSYAWACSSTETCVDYYTTYCGGGAYVNGTDPTLTDLIIEDNVLPLASSYTSGLDTYYTYSYGGGLCFLNSDSASSLLNIQENYADQGGAVYVDEYSDVGIEQTSVVYNTSTDGAGFEVDGGRMTLINVITSWNEAGGDGGGVLVVDGQIYVTNMTQGGDDATNGGCMYLSGSSTANVINTIVYGSPAEGVLVDGSSAFGGTYNNVYGNSGGNYSGISDPTGSNGNISANPLFTAYTDDGNPNNEDLHLGAGSPSIDAGHVSGAYNDADGSRNDQGAYGGANSDWQ